MKNTSKSSMTTQYIIVFGALLLAANILLGVILLRQSSAMVQDMIRKNMLNISNTAADLVDGDQLGAFTEEDVGSPAYNQVLRDLAAFQNNANIEFIYAVRQTGEDAFVFTVDPDPVDPGQFGEEVVVTPAMKTAGDGIAAVDDAPAADRWGNFYSSFSPVFDSDGNVAGIIGVDFNAEWYNAQVWDSASFVILISILFSLMGASVCILINDRVHKRFDGLRAELATLASDVEELTAEILASADYGEGLRFRQGVDAGPEEGDELRVLGGRILAMHQEMELYLDYMHARVNTDALTRVGNTTAYMERQKELEEKIQDGSASFSAVVYDINDLKHVNDCYGHTSGDNIIRAAASAIAVGFGRDNTFRIGGDEFLSVAEQIPEEKLTELLAKVDEAVEAYNRAHLGQGAKLSLSVGAAVFIPEDDHSFRDVFVRADTQMYARKDSYHRRNARRA